MNTITKYTYEDLQNLFLYYSNACKSRVDAQIIKKMFKDVVIVLGIEKGNIYSSIPHKEEEKAE